MLSRMAQPKILNCIQAQCLQCTVWDVCVCVQYVPMVTLKERAELLRRWVQSGENLSACEHNVRASRTANLRGKRVRKLVPVKDMAKPPLSFSATLGSMLTLALNECNVWEQPCNSGRKSRPSLPIRKGRRLLDQCMPAHYSLYIKTALRTRIVLAS